MDELLTTYALKQNFSADYRVRFRQGRQAAGFSLRAVGEACGISLQAISQFERGAQRLDLENFVLACDVMNLNVRWVLRGLGEMFEGSQPIPTRKSGRPARQRSVVSAPAP